jgi:tetratricopeptide (TPR) repeat protein
MPEICLALASIAIPLPKLQYGKWLSGLWLFGILAFSGYLSADAASHYFEDRGYVEKAIRSNPLRSELWMEKYNQAKNTEESLLCLKQALTWGRQNPFYWVTAARFLNTFFPDKKSDIAMAYQQATLLAPRHAPFWVQWGMYEAQNKNYVAAKICLKKAITLEPRSSLPYSAMAAVLKNEGQIKKAEGFTERAQENKKTFQSKLPKSSYSDFMFSLVNL